MKYRSDIDGLRALAVAAVVLFHASIWPFSGGYVGVDVFFVISGYLITNIILDGLARDAFSIVEFYERRIRRIFPALFAVVFVCIIAAYFVLLPSDFENFSKSLTATAVFASNVYFWRESGYFGGEEGLQPLLHIWSLAVEEQFYVLYPLLLVIVHRALRASLPGVLIGLWVASFAANIYFSYRDPTAAFFLTPMRIWELMTGCLLAVRIVPHMRHSVLNQAAGLVGIGCIIVAATAFDRSTLFPGFAALLPVMGTALVIYSGEASMTATRNLLSVRPLVMLGLVSYSLYLIHWPILSFYRHMTGFEGSLGMRGLLLVSAVGLAFLSWRFVERPFRRRSLRHHRLRVFAFAGSMTALVLAIGLTGYATQGAPMRFTYRFEAEQLMLARESRREMEDIQAIGTCRVMVDGNVKLEGAPCDERRGENRRVAILGDSHATHLYPGLAASYPGITFDLYATGGCRPLKDMVTRADQKSCEVLLPYVFDVAVPDGHYDAIIVSARWAAELAPDLHDTIEYLDDHTSHVIIVGPIGQYVSNLPELLAVWPGDYDVAFFDRNLVANIKEVDAILADTLADTTATYISLYGNLCQQGVCRIFAEDGVTPLQWDYGHLTLPGSTLVARDIIGPVLEALPVFHGTDRSPPDGP